VRQVSAGPRPLMVMIADDDEDTRVLLSEMVDDEISLILVGTASDANSAIELAEETGPDVAVVDWRMPEGGGPKVAAEITARFPQIRVIGISGDSGEAASEQMEGSGAIAFLQKGFSGEVLVAAIREAAG
jgi:DNA-binding NarL/FixJ family response regulator